MARFTYATRKTRIALELLLEDCFASGDIFPGEDPRIEAVRDHRGRVTHYALTLPA